MENIRSVVMAIVGLAAVAFVTVFAFSVGLALVGVLAVLTVARVVAGKLNRAPVLCLTVQVASTGRRAPARARARSESRSAMR